MTPIVAFRGVGKRFPGVVALEEGRIVRDEVGGAYHGTD